MAYFGTAFTDGSGFGQAENLAFLGNGHANDVIGSQNNHVSLGQYLDEVLKGASLVDIIDHGIGPFEDKTIHFQPSGFGVVCILNIPYNVSKSEIEHFLGRNASMIAHNEQGCSIHVIMERPTSKTMDCFVELLTPEAATDAYNKHENLVMSGKHPRIGTRHVDVITSSQDGLLSAIFPRARGLVWEDGVPRKIENTDPYSAGFQGFFTREEMIGMVRHAETPQRSPFSVKCLQRTFECMISTLYKFPWHAQHMYTLEDRAQLFDCYMKQLGILVLKVSEAQTVGLDTKLLIDFVSAGLNCAGFGERMRYMIAAHSGQVGASFPISKKSASWPFDVLSVPFVAPDGGRWWFEHADTLDLLMYIIELGYDVCGSDYVHVQWIQTLPSSPPSDFDQQDITSVRFKFREDVFNVSYDDIVSRETELMRQMLQVGFAKWTDNMCQAWTEGRFTAEMQRDVDCLTGLQQWDQMYSPSIGQLSISESPKRTATCEDEGYVDHSTASAVSNDGTTSIHDAACPTRGIDPTVDPFTPFTRRNSEPNMPTLPHLPSTAPIRSESSRDLTSLLHIDTATFRPPRQSSALEIRHPDNGPIVFAHNSSSPATARQSPILGTIGGHRASNNSTAAAAVGGGGGGGVGRSPNNGRSRHSRGAFSVDQTIHEENESEVEEITMRGRRTRRATDAGL